ncbi:protein ALP1-like [Humulus lupulus]|uniref:protein ALP1-like n=1 Tax=Humulus lupulus TaxID=3486 RepID=UPI002B4165A2|nr:protein ALP1-like [Humulus lupulus]
MSLNVARFNKDNLLDDADDEFGEILLYFAYEEYNQLYLSNLVEIQLFQDMNMLWKCCTGIGNSRYLSVEEQVAMFLFVIGHNERHRVVAERFQHSISTTSHYFRKVLKAICRLSKELITPPSFDVTPPQIRFDPRYYPFFKNCVGAIDGTHIFAHVPIDEQIPYRDRKVDTTQNVMCVCSFDMKFTYVVPGWEGSANDAQILLECATNPDYGFPMPPQGKYYLVDSGYTNMPGFLSPYQGERYHLGQYTDLNPTGKKELFNY